MKWDVTTRDWETIKDKPDLIKEALDLALTFGQMDGAHHKAWIIDQMVRILSYPDYEKLRKEYSEHGDYDWDTGSAP